MQDGSCRPAWPPCFIANAAPADPTARRLVLLLLVRLLQRIQDAAAWSAAPAGAAGAAGCDCEAGVLSMIELGLRS